MKPALEPLELLDAKGSAWVERHLRRQIEDPAAELSQITGKKLKHEFKRLLAHLAPGDHLCDWGWEGKIGPRDSYSFGWCLVRDGRVVYSICHSYS